MTSDAYEAEVNRVAYQLWVLAKMPSQGPEQFRDEAKEIIERRKRSSESDAGRGASC